MSHDLIDTTEMYLRTILELEEEGVTPLRARIAERLHQSGPTVSQTVARMERDGLVTVEGDRHLEFTDAGRHRAVSVMRKHRLAELLLVNIIGVEYEEAHIEACRWEHVMSDDVERKVYALLGRPTVSPYGNNIPGLEELDGQPHVDPPESVISLLEASGGTHVIVRRISEQLQTHPEVISEIHAAGVEPGALVSVKSDEDGVNVQRGAVAITLTPAAASLIFVSAS